MLWPGICSENIHKTNENSDCFSETFEYLIDNLSGRHLTYGTLATGDHGVKGHIDFHIAKIWGL